MTCRGSWLQHHLLPQNIANGMSRVWLCVSERERICEIYTDIRVSIFCTHTHRLHVWRGPSSSTHIYRHTCLNLPHTYTQTTYVARASIICTYVYRSPHADSGHLTPWTPAHSLHQTPFHWPTSPTFDAQVLANGGATNQSSSVSLLQEWRGDSWESATNMMPLRSLAMSGLPEGWEVSFTPWICARTASVCLSPRHPSFARSFARSRPLSAFMLFVARAHARTCTHARAHTDTGLSGMRTAHQKRVGSVSSLQHLHLASRFFQFRPYATKTRARSLRRSATPQQRIGS